MRFIFEKNTKPETFSAIINYIKDNINEDGELDFAGTFGNLDQNQREELLDAIHKHNNPKGITIEGATEAEIRLPLLTIELLENQTEINFRNEQLRSLTNNIDTLESELKKLQDKMKADPTYRSQLNKAKKRDAGLRSQNFQTLPDGYETFSAYQQRAREIIQDLDKRRSYGVGDERNQLQILINARDIDEYAANMEKYLRKAHEKELRPLIIFQTFEEGIKTAKAHHTELVKTIKDLEKVQIFLLDSIKKITPAPSVAPLTTTSAGSPAAPSAAASPSTASPKKAVDEKTIGLFAHRSGGASPKSPPSPGTPPSPGKNQIKADELEDLQMDEIISLVNHSGRDNAGRSLLLANIFQDNDKKQLFVDIFFKDDSAGEKLKKLGDPIFKQVEPIILEANLTRLRL